MEPFSILKALDFSLPAIGKSVSVVIKGLIVLILVAGLVWAGYVTFVRPHTKPSPTTTQKAEKIINYDYKPRISFGCAYWRLPDGKNRKMPEVQKPNDNKIRKDK